MSKRIIDQTTDTSLSTDDYVMVDNETEGSKKYDLGSKLSSLDSEIGDLSQLDTEVKTDLVSAINEAAQSGGEGLTDNERALILTLFSKAAYAEDDAGDAYDQLSALWSVYSVTWSGTSYTHGNTSVSARGGSTFVSTVTADGGHTISTVVVTMGGTTVQGAYNNGVVTIPNVLGDIVITVTTIQAEVSSISAVYTQSGTVYDTDSLDVLKSDLVVIATYVDQSTSVVPSTDYTLSGTLAEGTSTVTVTYGGKTTTFTVTVTQEPPYDFYDYIQGDGKAYINTGLLASTYCTNDYAQEIKVAGHATESAKAICGVRQQWGSTNARGTWHTNATYSQTYCGKDSGYVMSGTSLDTPVIIKTTTDKKIYCDDTLIDTATGSVSITHSGPIVLFAECTSGNGSGYAAITGTNAYAGAFSNARIYYFKVWDSSDNLISEIKPALRKSDSAIGMYDTVRDMFFENARNQGALSLGNE